MPQKEIKLMETKWKTSDIHSNNVIPMNFAEELGPELNKSNAHSVNPSAGGSAWHGVVAEFQA